MSYDYFLENSSDSNALYIDEDYDASLQSSNNVSAHQDLDLRRSVRFEAAPSFSDQFSEYQIEEHKVYTVKSQSLKEREKKEKKKEKAKKRRAEEKRRQAKKKKVEFCVF